MFEPNVDGLVANNATYVDHNHVSGLVAAPRCKLAVVACMDARLDPLAVLGLEIGDAHIMRNAGGVVTDDVIRSLCLSQRTLGTQEIILLHHTDCGLQNVDEAAFRSDLEAELGLRPAWALESFTDTYADVRQSIQRLKLSPFLVHKQHITGFVFDVADGRLNQVVAG